MLDLDIKKTKKLPFKEIMEIINAKHGFFYSKNSKEINKKLKLFSINNRKNDFGAPGTLPNDAEGHCDPFTQSFTAICFFWTHFTRHCPKNNVIQKVPISYEPSIMFLLVHI